MRFLLDTNILIYREDDRILAENVRELLALLHKGGSEILVHPVSLRDLAKDKEGRRREIVLSKVRSYDLLASPPSLGLDKDFLNAIGLSSGHSGMIDNCILYAVYRNAVDFLVTEDRGIHKKASRVGMEDRVLCIDEAIAVIRRYVPKESVITPPALLQTSVHNLDVGDPFFDSLRAEYKGFGDWFKRICREGRKCCVHRGEDGNITALLIFKIEDEPMASAPPLLRQKRLKLSTLKVSHEGHKIGELFVKISVDLAVQNGLAEIYLTHFTKSEDRLVELILEHGFRKVAVISSGEDVFLKRLVPGAVELGNMLPADIDREFYPSLYDGIQVGKFVIPIRPKYHRRLFTDFPERQLQLSESVGDFIVEGNTIRKAYLCHSNTRRMRSGDVLLFYMSGRQKLTSIGTVESVSVGVSGSEEAIRLVGKRTVYSLDEIELMAAKPTTVILFRHHFHLPTPLSLRDLKSMGALLVPPQSLTLISHRAYEKIVQRGGIDGRYTIR